VPFINRLLIGVAGAQLVEQQVEQNMPVTRGGKYLMMRENSGVISRPTSTALRPAAWPMISGTAIMPSCKVSSSLYYF